jgi:4-hydroxy-tetrahydrodipicolinate reductase
MRILTLHNRYRFRGGEDESTESEITLLQERGHQVVARVDPVGGDADTISPELAKAADVAIEFALPAAVMGNIELYCKYGVSAVIGTTGWYDNVAAVRAQVEKAGIGFVYGSNYAVGAHLFFKIVAYATKLSNLVPGFDILAYELHHNKKKDSPSGTALTIAKQILDNSERKDTLVTEKLDRAIQKNELHFASVRGGAIPGTHTVLFDSEADTIELTHRVRSRGGLALGAVLAAEWLGSKKGFFTVEQFIDEILADKT